MSSFSILLMTIAVTAPAIEDPGVIAAELIADVRASEQWIHDVKSLVLRFEGTWTRTPAGIAQERNVFERRFPDMEINEDRFPSLRPTMSETVIIGFNMDQLYYEVHWPDQRYERKYFDGTQSIMVDGSDPDKIDNYVFDGMPGPSRDVWDGFLKMDLSWLQAAPHSFWWEPIDAEAHLRGQLLSERSATITGCENYRGVECHVIELRGGFETWYVGVENHLLHGRIRRVLRPEADAAGVINAIAAKRGQSFKDARDYYAWKATQPDDEQAAMDREYSDALIGKSRPQSEHFLLDYRELRPGYNFPHTQGYTIYSREPNEEGEHFVTSERTLKLVEASVNDPLPDKWFEVELQSGIQVFDNRQEVQVSYSYDPNMTDEQISALVEERKKELAEFESEDAARDKLIGQPAFPFPEGCGWMNGEPLSWEALKGKVVVLDFWAIWCGPCRGDLPNLAELHEKQGDDSKLVIIGVHTPGSSKEDIQSILDQYKMKYPICIDVPRDEEHASWGELSAQFEITGIPHLVLIDADGKIAAHGSYEEIIPKARSMAASRK